MPIPSCPLCGLPRTECVCPDRWSESAPQIVAIPGFHKHECAGGCGRSWTCTQPECNVTMCFRCAIKADYAADVAELGEPG